MIAVCSFFVFRFPFFVFYDEPNSASFSKCLYHRHLRFDLRTACRNRLLPMFSAIRLRNFLSLSEFIFWRWALVRGFRGLLTIICRKTLSRSNLPSRSSADFPHRFFFLTFANLSYFQHNFIRDGFRHRHARRFGNSAVDADFEGRTGFQRTGCPRSRV